MWVLVSAPGTTDVPLLDVNTIGNTSGILPPPVSASLVQHYCRHEWARHIDDVMIRRTSWRHYHRDHLQIAMRVARWMAAALDWNEATLQQEILQYLQR